MKVYLTKSSGGTRDITELLTQWTWSGDKTVISRQMTAVVLYGAADGLPVPELGDLLTMTEDGTTLFTGGGPAAVHGVGGNNAVLHSL